MKERLTEYLFQNYDTKLIEMLTGKLLGDGNILIENNKSPRFRFGHAKKDRIWCLTCYQLLREYIQLCPPKFRRVFDKRLVAGFSDLYYVQSNVDDLFVFFKKIWYPGGVKNLPLGLIKRVLTPLCLAWWYQDDGNLKVNKNNPEKIVISTESFTRQENISLRDIIKEKYNISFSIDGQNRLVLYNKPSIYYFLSIVRPYLVIKRKDIFLNTHDSSNFPLKHRTSLYISSKLDIKKPTKEIKMILNSAINKINSNMDLKEIYHFSLNNRIDENKKTKAYQVELNSDELSYLAFFQNRTGLTKGECIEYWYYFNTKN